MGVAQDTAPAFDAFKMLVWDTVVQGALASLFAAVPILAWPPIAAFITWIVSQFSGYLYAGIKLFIVVELIVFRNKQLQDQYAASSISLQDVAYSDGIESDRFKKARDDNKKALAPFLKYDRARTAA